jgi:hypothetical protein
MCFHAISRLSGLASALLISLLASSCGGVVLSSKPLATPTDDPAFLNYGLPRAKLVLAVKQSLNKTTDFCDLSVTSEKLVFVRDPDPKFNYRLIQHNEWFTSDTLTVETDGAGLLKAINATSENKAVDILRQGLDLSTQVVKATDVKGPGASPCPSESFNYVLDPENDLGPDSELNKALGRFKLRATIRPLETVSDAVKECDGCRIDETRGDGIYYRVLRSYSLDVETFDVGTEEAGQAAVCALAPANCKIKMRTLTSIVFAAPDAKRTYFMPLRRKWFVKFDAKLTFDRGVLTKFESANPSQALAALQLPGDVIKSILGLSTATSSSAVSKSK